MEKMMTPHPQSVIVILKYESDLPCSKSDTENPIICGVNIHKSSSNHLRKCMAIHTSEKMTWSKVIYPRRWPSAFLPSRRLRR
ncbi:Os10g0512001 [Oryza sativa Japonica Group]|uniref:Os10g0512001 protein n=1 Tax=Oryza sativa subsp. japonica TaxID=39947 RepID=A0A0P0XW48_ORYSJ|nr:hypothetical protein EE612_052256 [Oryza sativa]BAT11629.1 Os10g0512001 [Oryza sativa Japonica Group]